MPDPIDDFLGESQGSKCTGNLPKMHGVGVSTNLPKWPFNLLLYIAFRGAPCALLPRHIWARPLRIESAERVDYYFGSCSRATNMSAWRWISHIGT
jgi:hypothetical protein